MNSSSTNRVGHRINPGETLLGIARQHGVTLEALLAANPAIQNPDRIQAGQTIVIPSQAEAPPAPAGLQKTSEASSPSEADPNRILFEIESTGASNATAQQDKLPARGITGVKASETMAETDRQRVMQHKAKFEIAAGKFDLPPALLAAIASRESRGGNILKNGLGDNGHGFGLMQVDDQNPLVEKTGGPTGQPHINQATSILKGKLLAVQGQFPGLSTAEQLQTAVSRYNGGAGKSAPHSDEHTTGGDYMNDVWARARFYARVEQWSIKK